jgi:hypothetical protein
MLQDALLSGRMHHGQDTDTNGENTRGLVAATQSQEQTDHNARGVVLVIFYCVYFCINFVEQLLPS